MNFLFGQALGAAGAAFFPMVLAGVWWRGLTDKSCMIGKLTGGLLSLLGIALTGLTDLKWIGLDDFWARHPAIHILCGQPAMLALPLATSLMVIVSRRTKSGRPADSQMRMQALPAPVKPGSNQENVPERRRGG